MKRPRDQQRFMDSPAASFRPHGWHHLPAEKLRLLEQLEAEADEAARKRELRIKAKQPLAWLVLGGSGFGCDVLPDGGGEVLSNKEVEITVPRSCVRWLNGAAPPLLENKDEEDQDEMAPERARLLQELREEIRSLG